MDVKSANSLQTLYLYYCSTTKRSDTMPDKKEAFDRQKGGSKKGAANKTEAQPAHLSRAVERAKAQKARLEAEKGPAVKAEHTVVSGDTLSGLAAKYYGSGSRENWMAIYEANKEEIGDNPSLIRVGQVLQIPELED
jgi:nucleoid-associated protein YgaU